MRPTADGWVEAPQEAGVALRRNQKSKLQPATALRWKFRLTVFRSVVAETSTKKKGSKRECTAADD